MNEDPNLVHPYRRMTLTFAGIARAHLVVVTVSGADKADALAAVAAGEDLPAARIEADRVVWLVDDAAASGLSR
jgi:6-phosphogluconolactonase/glucosamine-6-phosphate isomerase/deaminase